MSAATIDTAMNIDSAFARQLDRLQDASGRIVGSFFYGTLLRTMRESEMKGQYGHGGRGEEIFAAQLHGILAERMGEAEQNGLAKRLYRHLERQQEGITRARFSKDERNG